MSDPIVMLRFGLAPGWKPFLKAEVADGDRVQLDYTHYIGGKDVFSLQYQQPLSDGEAVLAKTEWSSMDGFTGKIQYSSTDKQFTIEKQSERFQFDFSAFEADSTWTWTARTDNTYGGSWKKQDGTESWTYRLDSTNWAYAITHDRPDGYSENFYGSSTGVGVDLRRTDENVMDKTIGEFKFGLEFDGSIKYEGGFYKENGSTIEQKVEGDLPTALLENILSIMFGEKAYAADGDQSERDRWQKEYHKAESLLSPLVLDLDGDGVETISKSSNVFFDHDGNGFAENTGWVGKDDGLLVYDKNGNGQIDDGSELFGNNTRLQNGDWANNGFSALADLDSNKDGLFDSRDSKYLIVGIWQDLNSDGVMQSFEHKSLAQAGVQSINLNYEIGFSKDENDNEHRQLSTFTTTQGEKRSINDVWFNINTMRTIDKNPILLSSEIENMPDVKGMGNAPSLWQAMAKDSSGKLLGLVKNFTTTTDTALKNKLVQDIIYNWMGVEDADPESRNSYKHGNTMGDARKLMVIEKIMGEGFAGAQFWGGVPDINPINTAAAVLLKIYDQFERSVYIRLESESLYKYLGGKVKVYIENSGVVSWDASEFVDSIKLLHQENPDNAINLISDLSRLFSDRGQNENPLINAIRSLGNSNTELGQILKLFGNIQANIGTSVNDVIQGTNLNDFLQGLGGDDVLDGGRGDDQLSGGLGHDILSGGEGSDTYIYNKGDGFDFIWDTNNDSLNNTVDTLAFGLDISTLDIELYRLNYDLTFNLREGPIVTIVGHFDDRNIERSNAIDKVTFADGTTWDYNFIKSKLVSGTDQDDDLIGGDEPNILHGGAGHDAIRGWGGDDILYGDDGNDEIYGGAGNDALSGGAGNDKLFGDGGDNYFDGGQGADFYLSYGDSHDTYVMRVGDGRDIAYDMANSIDIVMANAELNSIKYERDEYSTLILALNDNDQLHLMSFFNGGFTAVNISIKDNLGTTIFLDFSAINKLVTTGGDNNDSLYGLSDADYIKGKGGNDLIVGNEGNDTIEGGRGDDSLDGGSGNDTYVYERGDGRDVITNYDAAFALDKIKLQDLNEQDINVYRRDYDLFFRVKGTAEYISVRDNYMPGDGTGPSSYDRAIDSVEFANGTVWDTSKIEQVAALQASAQHYPTLKISTPDLRAIENVVFSYTIPEGMFEDIDVDDTLFYNIKAYGNSPLPSWLSFDASTRTLSGTPTSNDLGQSRLMLWGSDDHGNEIGDEFYLLASGPNHAPVLNTPAPDVVFSEGNSFLIRLNGHYSDEDIGDLLTYTIALEDGRALPSWMSFNLGKQSLTGVSPTSGIYNIKFTATDTAGASAFDVFTVQVNAPNRTITGTNSADNLEGGSGNDRISGIGGNDYLLGRDGNDRLDGGAGDDTMIGGGGNDTYVISSTNDLIIEDEYEGFDTVESSISWTLKNNIESLVLLGSSAINGTGNDSHNIITGNSAINTLIGGGGNDTLDGKGGADKLQGGTGEDTYIIDNINDVITELTNSGIDSVYSAVTYTLSTNVENLYLTGSSVINAIGNSSNNTLAGNASANTLTGGLGNDRLDGMAGGDKLIGGVGDDVYVIDNTSDVVTENTNEGNDRVESWVSYTLVNNVENIALLGESNLNGTGNSLNNYLQGNNGNNMLSGGVGNDTFLGGKGNDNLNGGAGNDLYEFSRNFAHDTLLDSDATKGNNDIVSFVEDIRHDQLWFKKLPGTNDLNISIIGTDDDLTITNWYLSTNNQVEKFKSSDGKVLLNSNVESLVTVMSGFATPSPGEFSLSTEYHQALDGTFINYWL
ncbi:putative Ig domain-containing protein [Pseudomonas syringae]|nr:putative Ig domain-containing protein [Pseudomonas syringae]